MRKAIIGEIAARQFKTRDNAARVTPSCAAAAVHLERTLHFTPANQSDDYRRAYIAVGTQFERPRATPRRFPWQERQAAARAARAGQ